MQDRPQRIAAFRALRIQTFRKAPQRAAEIAEPTQRAADVLEVARDRGTILSRGREFQRALETLQRFWNALSLIIQVAATANEFVVRGRIFAVVQHRFGAVERLFGIVEPSRCNTLFRTRKQRGGGSTCGNGKRRDVGPAQACCGVGGCTLHCVDARARRRYCGVGRRRCSAKQGHRQGDDLLQYA